MLHHDGVCALPSRRRCGGVKVTDLLFFLHLFSVVLTMAVLMNLPPVWQYPTLSLMNWLWHFLKDFNFIENRFSRCSRHCVSSFDAPHKTSLKWVYHCISFLILPIAYCSLAEERPNYNPFDWYWGFGLRHQVLGNKIPGASMLIMGSHNQWCSQRLQSLYTQVTGVPILGLSISLFVA